MSVIQQIADEINSRQDDIKARIAACDGARKACLTIAAKVSQYVEKSIAIRQKEGVLSTEEIKALRDATLEVIPIINEVSSDAATEGLMIKGEARAMLYQIKSISAIGQSIKAEKAVLAKQEEALERTRLRVVETPPQPPSTIQTEQPPEDLPQIDAIEAMVDRSETTPVETTPIEMPSNEMESSESVEQPPQDDPMVESIQVAKRKRGGSKR